MVVWSDLFGEIIYKKEYPCVKTVPITLLVLRVCLRDMDCPLMRSFSRGHHNQVIQPMPVHIAVGRSLSTNQVINDC